MQTSNKKKQCAWTLFFNYYSFLLFTPNKPPNIRNNSPRGVWWYTMLWPAEVPHRGGFLLEDRIKWPTRERLLMIWWGRHRPPAVLGKQGNHVFAFLYTSNVHKKAVQNYCLCKRCGFGLSCNLEIIVAGIADSSWEGSGCCAGIFEWAESQLDDFSSAI